MREGTKCKACPICGGQIVLSEYYSFSYDRLLGKNGKFLKKSKKSPAGPVNCATAACRDCGEMWQEGDFGVIEGRFIDFKDREDG